MPLSALPHGRDFRFLDSLLSLEPGKRGAGVYLVRGDEPFLAAHFPGQPLMPGVIFIEAVAQLAGVVAQSDPEVAPLGDLRLTAVRGAKITGTVGPGAELEVTAEVTGRMGGLVQASGTVTDRGTGQVLLTTQVTLSGTA